jgi:hypothetical protein
MRKSENGEFFKIDTGKPPISFPDGEIIRVNPPPIAPTARNNNKVIRIFFAFIVLSL